MINEQESAPQFGLKNNFTLSEDLISSTKRVTRLPDDIKKQKGVEVMFMNFKYRLMNKKFKSIEEMRVFAQNCLLETITDFDGQKTKNYKLLEEAASCYDKSAVDKLLVEINKQVE